MTSDLKPDGAQARGSSSLPPSAVTVIVEDLRPLILAVLRKGRGQAVEPRVAYVSL